MNDSHILGSIPDRSQYLPGTYVRLLSDYKKKGVVLVEKNQIGVVVKDPHGRCKSGQVAVALIHMRADDYIEIPKDFLNFLRGEHE